LVTIRREDVDDAEQVRVVNTRAFGRTVEADVVDTLRGSCPEGVSLVAVCEGQIVGHILFTPAVVESGGQVVHGMALAPLAVLPEFQRQGVGSELIQAGVAQMKAAGHPFIHVVGHPGYYPRFGFVRASRYGIVCEFAGVPDEASMFLILDDIAMEGKAGVARYRPEWAAAASSG
jgi:putative acetyltransferase